MTSNWLHFRVRCKRLRFAIEFDSRDIGTGADDYCGQKFNITIRGPWTFTWRKKS